MHKTRALFLAVIVALATGSLRADVAVEVGEINGVTFRIDMPEAWNQVLILYCHGFNASPVNFDATKPLDGSLGLLLKQGYAVAQSAYAEIGWALSEAIPDTEALRRYFLRAHNPKEVYVTGQSSGGLLTIALVEMFPNIYDGGLSLCGVNGPTA